MMTTKFSVFYDACTLYPAPLRDLLMQLSLTTIFRAHWSNQVHEEWIFNLLKKNSKLKREQLERVKNLMNKYAPDSLVEGYEFLIDSIVLPDLNDRHIVAAAYHSRSDVIVTFNLKDFPEKNLVKYNLRAQHPDDFLIHTFDLNPQLVISAIREIRQRLRNPPKSKKEYLDILRRQNIPKFVDLIYSYSADL